MAGLVLSLIALLGPPALARHFTGRPGVAAVLDGMVVAAIGSIVALEVMPEAVTEAGWGALLALLLGLAIPWAAERLGVGDGRVDLASLLIGQSMLLVHAGLDGLALATAAHVGPALVIAVVLHQVPVGLAVWASADARQGPTAAWVLLVAMGLVTAGAYWAGASAMDAAPPGVVGMFEAGAAGTLLHVVGHGALPGAGRHPRLSGGAALLTLGTAALLHATFAAPHPVVTELGVRLLATAPWWLGGLALAGAVRATGGPPRPIVAAAIAAAALGPPSAFVYVLFAFFTWGRGGAPSGEPVSYTRGVLEALLGSGAAGLVGALGAALVAQVTLPDLGGPVAVVVAAVLATALRAQGPGVVLLGGGLVSAGLAPGAALALALPALTPTDGRPAWAFELASRVALGLAFLALPIPSPSPGTHGPLALVAAAGLALLYAVSILDAGPRTWISGAEQAPGDPEDAGHAPGAHRH